MPSSEQAGPKKWGVGVELAEHHLGPVHFVAALIDADSSDICLGLHVLPDHEVLHPLVTHAEAREIRDRVASDVATVMLREGLAAQRTHVELVEDDDVERGLSESAERLGVDALIVGRRARRDEDPIVRLGEVTRRLLRRLPVPVVVVPPDFGEDDVGFGDGPVIVGVDLSEHSVPAVLFAADLARRFGRSLVLAHGTQAFHWGVSYIPAETMERLQQQARETATNELREWVAPMGLGDVTLRVFMGDPAKNLLQIAYDQDAALLVTGSRLLGPVERLFLASVSSEVAAAASCPVAVVPGV